MKTKTLLLAHLLARHACLWATLGLLAALAFGPLPAQAAVTEAWVHRYSNVVSNSDDRAFKVVRDAAGDIIVAGFTDDRIQGPEMLTIKYSGADGSVLWQQRHSGPANTYSAVAVDGSGNVVVTGSSATLKYAAADGALLWEQRYDGPANRFSGQPQALAVDGSGNVVVTGSSHNGTNYDYYTAKYAAADGTLRWENRSDGPENSDDYAQAVAVDSSDNVVVTGSSYNGTNSDYYTAKYSAADGTLLWEKRYNGPANNYDRANAVAVDASGNVVVTGASYNGTNSDYYTAKYSAADGTLLWEKRYNDPANGFDEARAVAVDGNGDVVVTGPSQETTHTYDNYTAKYAAADGALLWEKRYNGSIGSDVANAVAVDGSGNVVVTGYSVGMSLRDYDYYTVKYAAANGTRLWEKRYNGPANNNDEAQSVTVDGSDNVVVTGYSVGSGGYYDYYTAKYAAVDGALVWEQRANHGPANNDDAAYAVAVDGSGNVLVTGYSYTGSDQDSAYTAKYAAADGALLWEQRANGGGQAVAVDRSGNVVVTGNSATIKYRADGTGVWTNNNNAGGTALAVDRADNVVVMGSSATIKYLADGTGGWANNAGGTALAVDGNGNVVVTGYSYNTNSRADYYTAKYAAADGALLWEQRYNSPANGYEYATALAVDGSGNVVVTGYSRDFSGYADHYTAMYAAANGALLWEQHYYSPDEECGYYSAQAVAVDDTGNVAMTVTTYYGDYTAKYAVADGALLWEKRDGGLANSYYSLARAVAVDGSGNVVVTGSSYNGTNTDYYTAKYATADGAVLWEKRYNGPANGNDIVGASHSLAFGPNGMVAVTGSSSGDYATVVYRDDVYPISIALVPTGIGLRFIGIPGRSYTIERAPAVTGPWSTLSTQTAPASGLIEYDDAPSLSGQAFYRTVQP